MVVKEVAGGAGVVGAVAATEAAVGGAVAAGVQQLAQLRLQWWQLRQARWRLAQLQLLQLARWQLVRAHATGAVVAAEAVGQLQLVPSLLRLKSTRSERLPSSRRPSPLRCGEAGQ